MKINIIKINKYIKKNILITKKNIEINIKITTKNKIKKLNKKYRNKNNPTDTLTFKNYQNKICDIILCLKMIKKAEIEKSIVHCIFHILDYDHKEKKDHTIMKHIEFKLFNKLGMSGIEPPTITTSK